MDFYWIVFGVLAAAIAVLLATQASEGSIVPAIGANVAAYKKHMQGYVVIYSLMMRKFLAVTMGSRSVKHVFPSRQTQSCL